MQIQMYKYFPPLLSAIRDQTLSSPIVAFNTLYNKLKLIEGSHLHFDRVFAITFYDILSRFFPILQLVF